VSYSFDSDNEIKKTKIDIKTEKKKKNNKKLRLKTETRKDGLKEEEEELTKSEIGRVRAQMELVCYIEIMASN